MQQQLDKAVALYNDKKFEEAYELFYPLAAYERNADAQYYLGLMYFDGDGLEKSIENAQIWWKKATRNRHRDAAYRLSEIVTSTKTMF